MIAGYCSSTGISPIYAHINLLFCILLHRCTVALYGGCIEDLEKLSDVEIRSTFAATNIINCSWEPHTTLFDACQAAKVCWFTVKSMLFSRKNTTCIYSVVCLRGGERDTFLGPPFLGAPLQVLRE